MSDRQEKKTKVWENFWEGLTSVSEIQMWDYYGGRQWVTKYAPRFCKVIEAGCGAGRYNFYLQRKRMKTGQLGIWIGLSYKECSF